MTWCAITKTNLMEGFHDLIKPHVSNVKGLNKHLTKVVLHFSYQDPPPQQEKYIPMGLVIVAVWGGRPLLPLRTVIGRPHPYYPLILTEIVQLHEDQLLPVDGTIPIKGHAVTLQVGYNPLQRPCQGFSPSLGNHPLPRHAAKHRQGRVHHHEGDKHWTRKPSFGCDLALPPPLPTQHETRHPICSYFTSTCAAPQSLTSTNIVSLLFLHATKIGFQRLGLYSHEISSHSLHSGGPWLSISPTSLTTPSKSLAGGVQMTFSSTYRWKWKHSQRDFERPWKKPHGSTTKFPCHVPCILLTPKPPNTPPSALFNDLPPHPILWKYFLSLTYLGTCSALLWDNSLIAKGFRLPLFHHIFQKYYSFQTRTHSQPNWFFNCIRWCILRTPISCACNVHRPKK